MRTLTIGLSFLLALVAAGCPAQPPKATARLEPSDPPPAPADEKAVRDVFARLQLAIKNRDLEGIWSLLDNSTRADAESAAKTIRATYPAANADKKAEIEAQWGMSGIELAEITSIGILKVAPVQRIYREMPDSKVEKVSMSGDKILLNYLEADGDKDAVYFIRQDGEWRVVMNIPKFNSR